MPGQLDDHQHAHEHDSADEHCWYRGGPFAAELTSHLPFSILSVAVGLMLAGLICFLVTDQTLLEAVDSLEAKHAGQGHESEPSANGEHEEHGGQGEHESLQGFLVLFHLFHPAHMLFSAAATAAMFMRHEKNWGKAALVGFTGAVIVCGISDIVMPQCSIMLMGKSLPWHICVLEHPMLVFPFAGIGVIVGVLAAAGGTSQSTIFSHSMHVFVSTMASIFYLIGPFGRFEWIHELGGVFLFICVAVMIPCCLSDIVYPLLFTRKAREEYSRHGHQHPH